MGSLSRKLRRAAKNNKQYNVDRTLSEAEYNAVVKEVKEYLIDDVLYDTLSVVVDILQNNWGKMTKKRHANGSFWHTLQRKATYSV